MAFWIRAATLVIGSNKYDLDGMNFTFNIPFEDSDEPPVATVTVTNLSANTRNGIKKDDPVILNAGYQGNVGCILVGKVVGLKHKQNNVDWTSTLTVQPCAEEILGRIVNKTYTENVKASAIIRDLLNIFGVEVARCELSIDTSYPRGRVCRGNLKKVLTEIVVNECKSRFIVRTTGQVYITKADDGINNGVTLTPATGLLRSDEETVAIQVETDLNSQKTGEDRKEDTISRSCLLNYAPEYTCYFLCLERICVYRKGANFYKEGFKMMKHRIEMTVYLERYPRYCQECPLFYQTPYSCHLERGLQGGCRLGYMEHTDVRDFCGDKLFPGCHMKTDKNVIIER